MLLFAQLFINIRLVSDRNMQNFQLFYHAKPAYIYNEKRPFKV